MDSDPVVDDPNGEWSLDSQTVTQNEAGQVQKPYLTRFGPDRGSETQSIEKKAAGLRCAGDVVAALGLELLLSWAHVLHVEITEARSK